MPCLGGTRQKLLCWLLIMEKIWLVYVSNFSYTNLLVFRCNIILDGETPCREAIGGCLQDVLLLNWGPFSFFCLFLSCYPIGMIQFAAYDLQGLAFQLIDDVLDFTGTSKSLGKGSLSDIRHVIHFCHNSLWCLECDSHLIV